MSKLRDMLENYQTDRKTDDLLEQIKGYFEDVTFMLESLGDMEMIPHNIQNRLLIVFLRLHHYLSVL